MTFHPAKVINVIRPTDKNVKSSDESTQATLEMWDENLFTFLVEPKIADDVKESSIVLVDYTPIDKMPIPSHKVVKVIKGKEGEEIWKKYREFHKKRMKMPQTSMMPQPSYMG